MFQRETEATRIDASSLSASGNALNPGQSSGLRLQDGGKIRYVTLRFHPIEPQPIAGKYVEMSIRQHVKKALFSAKTLGIPRIMPRIVSILPHDEKAFTQGLAWHGGSLYESPGLATDSSLRRIDPGDGAIVHRQSVPDMWAEGLTILDGKLVQLTWQNGAALAYSVDNLERTGEFAVEGEGWGLTNDGEHFIMSDGSSQIRFRDAAFEPVRHLSVRYNGLPLKAINDIEFGDGKIFANVLFDDNIYEISPETGQVLRLIDCSCLRQMADPQGAESVLNGIAFEPDSGYLFATGKNWRYIFFLDVSGIPVV